MKLKKIILTIIYQPGINKWMWGNAIVLNYQNCIIINYSIVFSKYQYIDRNIFI